MIPVSRPLIGSAERAAADRVLASGGLAQGPEVAAFEEEFSAWVDGRECVAVSSGTAALHLGLLAAGIGPGDEVIVPSFTFAATANAVALCGAMPVFADIDPASFCLDPAAVEAALTPRTAAVMAVHLYGHPAHLPALSELCSGRGLLLVEDAAQAHGASFHGRPVGSWGALGMFSFYPTKNMTTGEGGMIATADPELARTARLLRNQGMAERYRNEVIGFNARMTDLGAAIGRVQLGRLAGLVAARRANAARYDAELRGVVTPPVADGAEHAYHQYTVRGARSAERRHRRPESADRDLLAERLAGAGIGTGVYYPVPVHRLPAYDLDLDLPETERACAEVLSLPVRPDLTTDEIAAVIEAVNPS